MAYVPGKPWVFQNVQGTSGQAEPRGSNSAIGTVLLPLIPQLSLLVKLGSLHRPECLLHGSWKPWGCLCWTQLAPFAQFLVSGYFGQEGGICPAINLEVPTYI